MERACAVSLGASPSHHQSHVRLGSPLLITRRNPIPHYLSRHHRARTVLLSCSSSPSISPQSPADVQTASQLKKKLFDAIEAAEGALDDTCLALVSSLQALGTVPDIAAHPELVTGALVLAKANFKEKRNDGEKRQLGYLGAVTTIGAVAFNMLQPVDLQVALYNMYQHVAVESQDSYNLITEFSVCEQDGISSPVQGLIINRARFSLASPNRFNIEFLSCGLRPRHPEKDMETWMKIFKGLNPAMDENGCTVVDMPMPIHGWSDLLYMDNEMRIQKGNRGGVSVLKLLKEPAVCI